MALFRLGTSKNRISFVLLNHMVLQHQNVAENMQTDAVKKVS